MRIVSDAELPGEYEVPFAVSKQHDLTVNLAAVPVNRKENGPQTASV
jgi:hypothetical protein